MPSHRHARPRPPYIPAVVGGLIVLLLLLTLVLVLAGIGGSAPAAYQPSPGVPTSWYPSSPHSGSQSCEREAIRSLARLVAARPSSEYEGSMQLAQEKQSLSPEAYAAVEATLNSVQIEFEQAGATGLAQIIQRHRSQIRQACAQAG
jgi:hypothetical protein